MALETWRYKEGATGHDAGFAASAFDDSAWAEGDQPFGLNDLAFAGPINTPWLGPNDDLCLRAHLDVPADATAVTLRVTIDYSGEVWVNGASIGTLTFADYPYKTFALSSWDVGDNVIAVRAHADAQQHRFAMTVAVARPSDAESWDVFAAAEPNGGILATIQTGAGAGDGIVGATERSVRVELNGPGAGSFKINRYSPVATAAILARGNFVKCRFPWRDDYDVGFWLEKGDFTLAAKQEKAGEEFSFGGRGSLAYLDRGVMDAVAYTTGLDEAVKLAEVWHTGNVPKPTGIAYRPSDPDYVLVISATKRRIYKVRQSDRKVVATSPELWSGDTHWAGGLTADPTDPDVLWALETPWISGSGANTKIRKISIATGIAHAAVTNTYDLGAATQLTDIRAATGDLYTTRYDNAHIQRRTRGAPATVAEFWTVTYKGHAQTHPNGVAISANGTGSEIAMWFGGTVSGGVTRALVADLSDPSTILRTINTKGVAAFGGDWSDEGGSDFFYMVSYTLGQTWKYQLTAATPHDPLAGKWRLDEGSPGAILWRVMQEAQAAARPQHPFPDLTYDFGFAFDSDTNAWDEHDGTKEFDADVTESILSVALRLLPYGLVEQMSPYLDLRAVNAADYGTSRVGTAFGAGVVRFEKGVNIIPELGRQDREREIHSHMLATGKSGLYARAVLADLGYVREGGFTTDLEDADALEGTAEARLDDERVKSERIRFAVPIPAVGEADESVGLYHPFTHYNVGDLVTLHTGSAEHDFGNETFVLYAFTLIESKAGTFEKAVLELGSATITEKADSGGGTGSGGSTAGGGSNVVTSTPITVEGIDDAGNTITSAIGTKIRAAGAQVYQEAADVIRLIIQAAGRLLDLDDVNADDISDGQTIIFDAATGTFIPGDVGTPVPWSYAKRDGGLAGDGVTDDTAAFQAWIDTVTAGGTRSGWFFFEPGVYLIAGAATGAFNAQISLPNVELGVDPQIVLTFQGVSRPGFEYFGSSPEDSGFSIIKSTLAGASGTAACIGTGPTGGYLDWNNISTNWKDLIFEGPDNPTFTMLDLQYTQGGSIDDVQISTVGGFAQTPVQPTHSNAYGVKLPRIGTSNYTRTDGLSVGGFYTGVLDGELVTHIGLILGICIVCMEIPHVAFGSNIVSGAMGTAPYGIRVTGAAPGHIENLTMVHVTSPAWCVNVADLDDPSDLYTATIRHYTLNNTTAAIEPFIVNGGANVAVWPVTDLLPDSGVTPGPYTAANITVDEFGRVTAAANGAGGTSATDANIWRPLMDGSGNVITDGAGQAVMWYGPA